MIAQKMIDHPKLKQKKQREILYELSGVKIDEDLRRVYSSITNSLIDEIKQERISEVYHFCFIPSDNNLLKGFRAKKGEISVNVLVMPGG